MLEQAQQHNHVGEHWIEVLMLSFLFGGLYGGWIQWDSFIAEFNRLFKESHAQKFTLHLHNWGLAP